MDAHHDNMIDFSDYRVHAYVSIMVSSAAKQPQNAMHKTVRIELGAKKALLKNQSAWPTPEFSDVINRRRLGQNTNVRATTENGWHTLVNNTFSRSTIWRDSWK